MTLRTDIGEVAFDDGLPFYRDLIFGIAVREQTPDALPRDFVLATEAQDQLGIGLGGAYVLSNDGTGEDGPVARPGDRATTGRAFVYFILLRFTTSRVYQVEEACRRGGIESAQGEDKGYALREPGEGHVLIGQHDEGY